MPPSTTATAASRRPRFPCPCSGSWLAAHPGSAGSSTSQRHLTKAAQTADTASPSPAAATPARIGPYDSLLRRLVHGERVVADSEGCRENGDDKSLPWPLTLVAAHCCQDKRSSRNHSLVHFYGP